MRARARAPVRATPPPPPQPGGAPLLYTVFARRGGGGGRAGQKAAARFQSAEAALRDGDFPRAMTEADAGRALAPWDARAPQLIGRIQRAQQDAQGAAQQREARERQARVAAQL